jgi:hypothetical protein
MATDLETSIRAIAEKVAQYVDDVATMTVQTEYVVVSAEGKVSFDQARPLARTVIKLDGDSQAIVPLAEVKSGRLEVDAALLELHDRSVSAAIEYRARMLNALLVALQSRIR